MTTSVKCKCQIFSIYTAVCYFIVSRGGWFGSSVVFRDDAMVMLLYWRKCLLLVGEEKFYGHVTAKDTQHATMRDYTN